MLGLQLGPTNWPHAWDSQACPSGGDAASPDVTLRSDAERRRLWLPRVDPGPPSGIGGKEDANPRLISPALLKK